MSKFQIGDRVRVVDPRFRYGGLVVGDEGTVVKINPLDEATEADFGAKGHSWIWPEKNCSVCGGVCPVEHVTNNKNCRTCFNHYRSECPTCHNLGEWTPSRAISGIKKPKVEKPSFKVGDTVRVKVLDEYEFECAERSGQTGKIEEVDNSNGSFRVVFDDDDFEYYAFKEIELVEKSKVEEPVAKYTVGDRVRYSPAEGDDHAGQIGVIEIDDKSSMPFLLRFEDNNTEWAHVSEVEPVAKTEKVAPAVPVKRRPTVGDKVRVVDSNGGHLLGSIGEIIKDDHSGIPFYICFADGSTKWACENRVELVTEEAKVVATVLPFKVGDKVKVLSGEAGIAHVGEVGEIFEIYGSHMPYRIRFADGKTRWVRVGQIELVIETPLGKRAGEMIGLWVYRLAPAIKESGIPYNSCMKDSAISSCPVKILSVDSQGIHLESNPKRAEIYGKNRTFPPFFNDSNWEEWDEPVEGEKHKYKVGDKIVTVKQLENLASYIELGTVGIIGNGSEPYHITFPDGQSWFADGTKIRPFTFGDAAKDEKTKDRELWLQAKERYERIRDIVFHATDCSGHDDLKLPKCGFCEKYHLNCSICPWKQAINGCRESGSEWKQLCNAQSEMSKIVSGILGKIDAQLVSV
jgi:transcription antitermination factor NusG